MTTDDDDRPAGDGVYQSETPVHPRRRRTQIVAGAASLAAVLGVGGYLVATSGNDRDSTTATQDVGVVATPEPSVSASTSPPSSARPTVSPSTTAASTASPSPTASLTVQERVAAARKAHEKDGVPLKRPLTVAPGVAVKTGPVTETVEGSMKEGGTLRTISAAYDLTGQRELLWIGEEEGRKVGDARCAQKFRFSNTASPKEMPTMMLCWRTSASRSVLTLSVAKNGRPNAEKMVAALERRWTAMS